MNDEKKMVIIKGVNRFCLGHDQGVPWKDPKPARGVKRRYVMFIDLSGLRIAFSVVQGMLDDIREELVVIDTSKPDGADQLLIYNVYPDFSFIRFPVDMPFAPWNQTILEEEVRLDGNDAMKNYLTEISRKASADQTAFDLEIRKIEQLKPSQFDKFLSSVFDWFHRHFWPE